jgi:pimeloyl-ACP methyl ester carboxylesterase
MSTTDWTIDAKGTGQYAEVNGITLYFETHGSGRPLILLHGGLGSGEMFGPVRSALAERHQVIAVDLQATAAPPISIARSTSDSWPTTSPR